MINGQRPYKWVAYQPEFHLRIFKNLQTLVIIVRVEFVAARSNWSKEKLEEIVRNP
jgi:hypothetical protein